LIRESSDWGCLKSPTKRGQVQERRYLNIRQQTREIEKKKSGPMNLKEGDKKKKKKKRKIGVECSLYVPQKKEKDKSEVKRLARLWKPKRGGGISEF